MKFIVALFALLAVVNVAVAQTAVARADFYAISATETGITRSANNYATFTQINSTHVRVYVHIVGIVNRPDDEHGMHIHTFGDLSSSGALGGHWDPHTQPHGCPPSAARHAGDLGNWQANGGTISQSKDVDLVELFGEYSVVGRAIVLHNGTDDCVNVPASGARLAAGVIGVASGVSGNEANAGSVTAPTLAVCTLLQTDSGAANGQSGTFAWMQSSVSAPVVAVGSLARLGLYGVHVHTYGDLSDRAAGTATAGHWDPFNTVVHAFPNSSSAHHAGDMGNTNPDHVFEGRQWFYESFDFMDLVNGANNETIIGRGFIVHQLHDDGTGTNGNAGARNAQCVVGYADASLTSVPVALPSVPMAPTPSGDASSLAPVLFVIATLAASLFVL